MSSIDELVAEAKAELSKEAAEKAKAQIKAKLREIADAKRIVANLEAQLVALQASVEVG